MVLFELNCTVLYGDKTKIYVFEIQTQRIFNNIMKNIESWNYWYVPVIQNQIVLSDIIDICIQNQHLEEHRHLLVLSIVRHYPIH